MCSNHIRMGANVSNYVSELNDSVTENISTKQDAKATSDCLQANTIDCKETGPNFSVSQTCSATATASAAVVEKTILSILSKVKTEQKNKGLTLFQVNVANTNKKISEVTNVNIKDFCDSHSSDTAFQKDTIKANYCNFPLKNVGNAKARCLYNLAMSTLMNEKSATTVDQSNQGISLETVFMIVAAVIVLIVVVMLARFMIRRGAKKNARNYAKNYARTRR